jgi:drug/metabolite transporter (DMT)-like permease
MFCIHCGTENRNDALFCIGCGQHIKRKLIEEIADEYKINVCIAIIVGLCTGVISGIFSATFSSTWHPELWQAIVILFFSMIVIMGSIFSLTKTLKESLERRIKRNL